jgi:hypothetical protein
MAIIKQKLFLKIPEFWKFWTTTISKLFHLQHSRLVWILTSMIPNISATFMQIGGGRGVSCVDLAWNE